MPYFKVLPPASLGQVERTGPQNDTQLLGLTVTNKQDRQLCVLAATANSHWQIVNFQARCQLRIKNTQVIHYSQATGMLRHQTL